MANLKVEVVTLNGVVFEGVASKVVSPTITGQITILPHHTNYLSAIDVGEVIISGENDIELHDLAVFGGFIEVVDNKVTIFGDTVESSDEIDEQHAKEATQRAEERVASTETDIDHERALRALQRSRLRLKVASHRKRKIRHHIPNTK